MKAWGVVWLVARLVTVAVFVTWLLVAAPEERTVTTDHRPGDRTEDDRRREGEDAILRG